MKKFRNIIDSQLELNNGINLFSDENLLKFSQESIQIVDKISESELDKSIDYIVTKVLHEFYRVNQYYNFNSEAKEELKVIYSGLYFNVKSKNLDKEWLAKNHSENLKKWILATNSFAEKIYLSENQKLEPVACFEYSSSLQLDILGVNASQLLEPVLDIGCGEQANLVRQLRDKEIEAYGIDRFPSELTYIENVDWLEYDYGINKWGAIISNLGFSNHFMHHHLREDGDFVSYAKKYMQILNALKIGGSFHYAPDLPFIEQYLDHNIYEIKYNEIGEMNYKSVVIKRLS